MKPLKEVCVGRRCCYDKEIPWHQWVASPALGYGPPGHTLTGRGFVPSGQTLVLWVYNKSPTNPIPGGIEETKTWKTKSWKLKKNQDLGTLC